MKNLVLSYNRVEDLKELKLIDIIKDVFYEKDSYVFLKSGLTLKDMHDGRYYDEAGDRYERAYMLDSEKEEYSFIGFVRT